MVKLGALVLQKEPWVQARDTWRQVERVGFDIGYVADHLTHPTVAGQWWADGWTTLAAAAEATSTLGLGTLVGSAAIRGPAFVARVAATLQDISGGRFVLGLGAGTAPDVLVDRGEVVDSVVLAERYREVVLAVRALWAGETTWRGHHVAVEGVSPAALAPGSPPPPLVLAAHARAGFDLVAEQADGWNTYGGPKAAGLASDDLWSVLAAQSDGVTQACERAGRDPASLRRSVLLGYGADRPLASVVAFENAVERAARSGFDEVVVYWPMGQQGGPLWADPDVVVAAVAAVRT